ncbi:MAG: UDP-2,3-diacylglucosamine diphosphatase [Nevskia sp.]|nr:UDP-2,3-diacylglucosamine diphosphatase [Nevskia sp.]
MSKPVLLISDLHLPVQPSPLRDAFLAFLAGPARSAETLFILGDLFEYWIGDDAGLVDYAGEAVALRELADSGVRVRLMRGNRDFLVGRLFAKAAALRIVQNGLRLDLAGTPTLLLHGDTLCTDDRAYQRWRRLTHNRLVRRCFLALPEALRRRIAWHARGRSEADKRNKPEAIMDVNAHAVRAAFRRHRVGRIIHGHTHRPADHRVEVDGHPLERIVLADWREQRIEYLVCDDAGCRRASFAAAP